MLDQSYTAKNFRRLLRPIDFSSNKYGLPSDKSDLEHTLQNVEAKFLAGTIDIGSLETVFIKGKPAYAADCLETDLVLRKLNDNVRRLYSIRQPDRNEIVGQLIELLRDGTPIQIVRRDIRSFYESVPRDRILAKIHNDYLLGWESKKLVNELFSSPTLSGILGLPRGLALSATLAELYMRTLDTAVKKEDGLLFYARYVDDIIAITFKREGAISDKIRVELNDLGLDLNVEKSPPALQLPSKANHLCDCMMSCQCDKSVEYLGYSIAFPKSQGGWDKKRSGRFVSVSLSKKKVERTKSRIARAFSEYCNTKDFELLQKRIAYLTSSYPLPLNKFKRKLKGGIYYHYPLVRDLRVLEDLDRFLRSIVFARKGSLGRRLRIALNDVQRGALTKYSFVQGFKKRYFVRLTQHELSMIKRCWRYA